MYSVHATEFRFDILSTAYETERPKKCTGKFSSGKKLQFPSDLAKYPGNIVTGPPASIITEHEIST